MSDGLVQGEIAPIDAILHAVVLEREQLRAEKDALHDLIVKAYDKRDWDVLKDEWLES